MMEMINPAEKVDCGAFVSEKFWQKTFEEKRSQKGSHISRQVCSWRSAVGYEIELLNRLKAFG